MSEPEDAPTTPTPDDGPDLADPVIQPQERNGPDESEAGEWDDDGIWEETDAEGGISQDKVLRLAQIGLVMLAVVVVAVVLVVKGGSDESPTTSNAKAKDGSVTATTAATTKKKKAAWPPAFNGRPAGLGTTKQRASEVDLTAEPGIYVWSDFDGMHIWAVKGDRIPPISGTLDSNSDIQKAVSAVDGSGTVVTAGKRVSFTLPGQAPIEGLDFNPGFYANKIVITLNGPDGPIDATLVKVGKKGDPASFPLVFERTVQN